MRASYAKAERLKGENYFLWEREKKGGKYGERERRRRGKKWAKSKYANRKESEKET